MAGKPEGEAVVGGGVSAGEDDEPWTTTSGLLELILDSKDMRSYECGTMRVQQ